MTYDEVHVRLVDATTGSVLSERKVPISSLPETFIPGKTALNIKSQPWTVVQAIPPTRAECTQTGQLTLNLTQDQPAPVPAQAAAPAQAPAPAAAPAPAPAPEPAKEILYPLPTMCAVIPTTTRSGENVRSTVTLRHDDWRQVELVSPQHDRAIDAEFYDIEGIVRDHSIKSSETSRAYKQIFARSRIKAPIVPGVPMAEIHYSLPKNAWPYGGVGYQAADAPAGADAMVAGSFAFDFGLCLVYGQQASDGAAAVIGLHRYGTTNYGDSMLVAAFIDTLMKANSLILVDWCWRRKIGAGADGINSYLQKKFA